MGTKATFGFVTEDAKEVIRDYARANPVPLVHTRRYDESGLGHDVDDIDYAESVRRGIILLNAMNPNWMNELDLDALDLVDTEKCILGQTYADNPDEIPGYDWKVKEYMAAFDLEPGDYGFDLPNHARAYIDVKTNFDSGELKKETSLQFERLTNTWKILVRERLAAAQKEESSPV